MRLDISDKVKMASDKGDFDEMIKYMKVKKKLDEVYNELTLQTNTVVIK